MSKIKYKLDIQLKTALHIGSGLIEDALGAANMVRNGKGEFIIPGTSIAGLFFDRLDQLLTENEKSTDQYKKIVPADHQESGNQERETDLKSFSSPYEFSTYFFNMAKVKPAIRDRVKINRSRKTAEDKAKFSHWEIEPYELDENPVMMTLEMTINTDKYLPVDFDSSDIVPTASENDIKKWDIDLLKTWAEKVFNSWEKDGLFIGAFSSSGCGWAILKSFNCYPKKDVNINDDNNKVHNNLFVEIPLRIIIKDEADGYGTNTLLIRGGEAMFSLGNKDDIEPDAVFMNNGTRLLIPGSSVKGVITAFLEKYGHIQWNEIFFGQTEEKEATAGKVYISDFYPDNFNKDHLAVINHHAQDEFTRAVLGSSKFDEEALFYTSFSGFIKIYKKDWNDEMKQMFELINNGMKARVISLGAHSTYPIWELELNHE